MRIERGSIGSQSVENWIWKMLYVFRQTGNGMSESSNQT
jgi:hypothetical protein